jgi:hypothetical protein
VNIKKLDPEDIEEDKISGGYILEMKGPDQLDLGAKSIDIAGDFVLAIEEPAPEDIPPSRRRTSRTTSLISRRPSSGRTSRTRKRATRPTSTSTTSWTSSCFRTS